jgi:hypothetical protein
VDQVSRLIADEVSDAVASTVRDALLTRAGTETVTGDEVRVSRADVSSTIVRVQPATGTPRYFRVQMTELVN